jgi:hypothetical protein
MLGLWVGGESLFLSCGGEVFGIEMCVSGGYSQKPLIATGVEYAIGGLESRRSRSEFLEIVYLGCRMHEDQVSRLLILDPGDIAYKVGR